MRFVGFIGPSYKLSSVNFDCQRCVNLYPEINEVGTGKEQEVASLVSTEGLKLLLNIGEFPIRGSKVTSSGRYFVASYNKIYEVSSSWVATEVGTISTFSGPVKMADSGNRLAIVDGSTQGFFYNYGDSTFTAIPFPAEINFKTFNGCSVVDFQDGYFIYFNKDSQDFFISGLVGSMVADDSTINILDFGKSEGNPDFINGMISDHRDLWMFNKNTIEIFFNSGDAFPFQRIQGAYIEHGLAATFSVAKANNTVYWLGQDETGRGIVYQARGYQPQRISTHAVELAIQGYANISDATAYTYQNRGHFFYVLNFPTANTTWVFDASTNLWHERAYTYQGVLQRHRGDTYAFAFGRHVVGDYENGNIYELTHDVYTDNGEEITRLRVAPHISKDMKMLRHDKFQLDIESGTGIDGLGQGVDPKAMLSFSDDGGHSWSNEKWASFGKIGQRKKRAIWWRLGVARDRVYKIKITDPVKVAILGAEIEVTQGAR